MKIPPSKYKQNTPQRELPFVWEILFEGVLSHAVGTSHIVPDVYEESAKQVMYGKEKLLLELDPFNSFPEHALRKIRNFKMDPLLQKLTMPEREEYAGHLGLSLDELYDMHPLSLTSRQFSRLGITNQTALDVTLLKAAIASDIPVHCVDTVENQMNLLERMLDGYHEQVLHFLKAARKTPQDPLKPMRNFIDAYLEGDEVKLLSNLEDHWPDFKDIEGRDKMMADKSEEHLQVPCVIGLGLAHFIVRGSILDEYKKKGIVVKRVQ